MSRVISRNQTCFPNVIIRKDKTKLDKHRRDVNTRMKILCQQKDIDLINNFILEEHHLGIKKLHLNNKGNSDFAKNNLHFIESWIANIDTFDEIRVQHAPDKLEIFWWG